LRGGAQVSEATSSADLAARGAPDDPTRPGQPLRIWHVAAVVAGNGLEFYDFLIYATFAIYIGKAFFPTHDPLVSLLLSLATFGIGFVTRPLGGVVLGRIGDRIGRKPALLISFALMAAGVLGIAITPTYAQIGPAAPALVILARLVQGFALGGEVGPSTAFLVEAAHGRRRGVVGSMQGASQGIAVLSASAVAVGLSFVLPADDLEHWGWRLAFAAGLLIVPFGLIARRKLPETAPHDLAGRVIAAPAPRSPIPWRLVSLGLMLITSGTIGTYVGSYMTTFAMDTLHLPARAAFGVGVVNGACVLVFTPLGGWLSDRLGRKQVMIPSTCIAILLMLPAYGYMVAHPSALTLYLATAAVSVPGALAGAPILVSITESFPSSMRCMAVGAIYALAVAMFGGTTQVVVAWLTHVTADPMAPTFYRLAAALIGLAAMLNLPESAPVRTDAPVLEAAIVAA
jgi:MFS transporter, MHS family, citrate/tricarballylate:H+ symporter